MIQIAAFYKATSHSGGDWWWFQPRPEGKYWFLVGDVTGHGAGSAMVTAMVASCYRILHLVEDTDDFLGVLSKINRNFFEICQENYMMSMALLEIDETKKKLRFSSFGHPPGIVFKETGTVEYLSSQGTLLGTAPSKFSSSEVTKDLSKGDRVLLYTDGAYEFQSLDGKIFGKKRFTRAVQGTSGKSAVEARQQIQETIFSAHVHGSSQFDDDITFLIVDIVQ